MGSHLAGPPSPLHEKMRDALTRWAEGLGFETEGGELPDGTVPDVHQINCDTCKLFIGDSKVADSQGPDDVDSHDQLLGYLQYLAESDGPESIFAVITDTEDAATGWSIVLDILAGKAGLPKGFQTLKIGPYFVAVCKWF